MWAGQLPPSTSECVPVGVPEASQASFTVLGKEGVLVMVHLVYISLAPSNPDTIYQEIITSAGQQLILAQLFMKSVPLLHISTIPELDKAR